MCFGVIDLVIELALDFFDLDFSFSGAELVSSVFLISAFSDNALWNLSRTCLEEDLRVLEWAEVVMMVWPDSGSIRLLHFMVCTPISYSQKIRLDSSFVTFP